MKLSIRCWLISGSICAVMVVGLLLLWQQVPEIAAENGLLENFQGAAFVLGALVAIIAVLARKEFNRFSGWFYALLLTSMVLREVDMDRIGLPDFIALLTSGTGRNLIMGILWLLLIGFVCRYWQQAFKEIITALKSFWGHHLLAGVFFYLIGALFDKKIMPVTPAAGMFGEELVETLGAFMIAYSALLWSRFGSSENNKENQQV